MKSRTFKLNLLVAGILAATSTQAQDVQELSTTVVETANEASVSHTITVISDEEIDNLSMDNIEDSVRYIPGVQVNDAGNRFGDNGFNIRGLQGNAVAVTVDGISLGDTLAPASFSAYGMYDSTRGQVELEHVKSIRITKGPSAVENGANALAGAVAYTTHDADDFLLDENDSTAFSTTLGYDSRDNEKKANITFVNRTGAFESLIQYTYREGNESEAHGDGRTLAGSAREQANPLDRESDALLVKLALLVAEGQKLGILYDSVDRTIDAWPLGRQSDTYYDFVANDENNKERYGLFYHWDDAEVAFFDSLHASVDVQELYTSGVTTFGYTSQGASYLRREDRSTTQDATVIKLDFEKYIDGDITHTLDYGLEWGSREIENVLYDRRYNDLTIASGYLDGYPIRDPSWVPVTESDTFTVYFSDEMQLTEQFKLSAGVRYDSTEYSPKVDSTFEDASGSSVGDAEFDAFIGELIAEYEFAPGHTFLASYTQGYRSPSAQDLYLGTDGSVVLEDTVTGAQYVDLDVVTNPDLEAEKSSSFELGYKLESDNASLTITGFWTTYEDRIENASRTRAYDPALNTEACAFDFATFQTVCVPVVLTEDEYTQPDNVGEVEVNGIEIDATYAFNDNLYTHFTFATIDGEYKTAVEGDHNKGDTLETTAPDSGTLTLGYQADGAKWGVALHGLWFDQVDESDELSFTSLNNGSGPAHYPDSYTVIDLTAFYQVTENLEFTLAAYNLTDKEYYRWEVVNSIRNGSGGFFGGVSEDGYKRYSEPGRSVSLDVTYRFF